ncbi:transcriptional repressor [Candidatus Woesearchaeota archaeon]|nr:transcriptional repressor [Candidatus Woesearchaeota archaeon]
MITNRETNQRSAVLAHLRGVKTHPTADEVYQDIKKILPHISKGTVYRNLHVLEENNIIKQVHLGGTPRYDGNLESHQHLICTNCKQVLDTRLAGAERAALKRALKEDFAGKKASINVYGICRGCQGGKK